MSSHARVLVLILVSQPSNGRTSRSLRRGTETPMTVGRRRVRKGDRPLPIIVTDDVYRRRFRLILLRLFLESCQGRTSFLSYLQSIMTSTTTVTIPLLLLELLQ